MECLRAAMKKNALARALRHPVDRGLYDMIRELCVERTGN
jgi:predicted RNA-binding protein YlxR (DUF448 family)